MRIEITRSGMLKAIEYDEVKNDLTVTFNNGGSYVYHDVPKEMFDGILAAESAGKYYLAHIKDKFKFEKL